MASTARRTDPELWEKVKRRVTRGARGGEPGQWSARKAQLAVQEYRKAGGGYLGKKAPDNSLRQWTGEEWGTRSGRPSRESGERYLPKRARERLTKDEIDRSTARKRADTAKGRQFSAQPKDVAAKAAAARRGTGKAAKAAPAAKRAAADSLKPSGKRGAPARTARQGAAGPRKADAPAAQRAAPARGGAGARRPPAAKRAASPGRATPPKRMAKPARAAARKGKGA